MIFLYRLWGSKNQECGSLAKYKKRRILARKVLVTGVEVSAHLTKINKRLVELKDPGGGLVSAKKIHPRQRKINKF